MKSIMLYNNTDQKLLQKLYHGVNHKTDIVGKKSRGSGPGWEVVISDKFKRECGYFFPMAKVEKVG